MPDLSWSVTDPDSRFHSMVAVHPPPRASPTHLQKSRLLSCSFFFSSLSSTDAPCRRKPPELLRREKTLASTRHLWERTAPRARGPTGLFPESGPEAADATGHPLPPAGHGTRTPPPSPPRRPHWAPPAPAPAPPFLPQQRPPPRPNTHSSLPVQAPSTAGRGRLESWPRSGGGSSSPDDPREPLRPAPVPWAQPAPVAASPRQGSRGAAHLSQGPATTGSPPPCQAARVWGPGRL